MEKAVLRIRRALTVVVVLLFVFWGALQFGTRLNADEFSSGIKTVDETKIAVQERWLCAIGGGGGCLMMNLAPQMP